MHGFHHASAGLAAHPAGQASGHLSHLSTGQAAIAAIVITFVLFLIWEGLKKLARGTSGDRD